MKKILSALFIAVLLCVGVEVYAEHYSGILSTYTVAGKTTPFAATYPTIAGGIKIDSIVFKTTDTLSEPILISVYNNATSTTIAAATANADDGYWVLNASSTANGVQLLSPPEVYPYHNPRVYTNPGFYIKSGGGSAVPLKIIYIDVDYH